MKDLEKRIRRLEGMRSPPPAPLTLDDAERLTARRKHIASLQGGRALLTAMDNAEPVKKGLPFGVLRVLVRRDAVRGSRACGYVWCPAGDGPSVSAHEKHPATAADPEPSPSESQ